MDSKFADDTRRSVREAYANVARASEDGQACGEARGCCGVPEGPVSVSSTRLGYSLDDVQSVPDGADMGLGCGNPRAIAGLKSGETVLDLGSGGGFDCFLAAREVGGEGRVIGVDMTPDMVSKARSNATKAGYTNVEFRLGEIEYLPVPDNSVDVIISNCVINLSPDKPQVFREAYRVLRPGGRLAISDVIATMELPDDFKNDSALLAECVSGALLLDDLKTIMKSVGLTAIRITPKDESRLFIRDWAPGYRVEDYLVSAHIEAVKPEF